MPVRNVLRLFLVSIFLVLGAMPGRSAVLIHLTFEEMTTQSSAILLGRCIEVRSVWNASHTDIVTQNVFEVHNYYKGNLGARVTITELGGQVGDWVAEYSGIPRFQVGEEAVLFVWTDPQGQAQVIGLTQGKFGVRRNSQTGEILLRQTLTSEPMMEPPAHSHSQPASQVAFPLQVFQQRVHLLLQKPSGGPRQ